jgi:predicted nuclease of predicted toxin-antitoxin system
MSLKLLLDENIPPQVTTELRRSGYDAVHVREANLRGHTDSDILAFAREKGRCLVTLDAEFADVRYHPLGSHAGIIRLKLGFAPSAVVAGVLASLLPELARLPLDRGALVVSDGKRYRVRTPRDRM